MMDRAETNGMPCVWIESTRGFEEGALQNWIDDGRKRKSGAVLIICIFLFIFFIYFFFL
jgi:hypothetical protein